MLKAIIIDDEKLARENMQALLKPYSNELEVIREANSVSTGIECIKECDCDLVFLDINLNDGSGFNILESLTEKEKDFCVIFVTAHNEFAINAFQVEALDYLMKPIDKKLLSEAIEKVKKYFSKKTTLAPSPRKLAINEGYSVRFVEIYEIERCISDNNYTEIHLSNGERIVSAKTLKEYDQILINYGFFRIHQSHLVNLKRVLRIVKNELAYVEMTNGVQLPVSRRKKSELMNKMEQMGIYFV